MSTEAETTEFGRLTPEGIERFREKIGVDWPYARWTTWNEEATRDGIRHYAYGFGDDNPLWCDPDHAAGQPLGRDHRPARVPRGRRAHPAHARRRPRRRAGARARCPACTCSGPATTSATSTPVREGDRLWVRRFYVDIDREGASRFGGRSALSVRRRVYWNDARRADRHLGRRLRAHRARHRRQARHAARRPREQHVYTDDELDDGRRALRRRDDPGRRAPLRRGRRGRARSSATRYRGPLVVGDVIAWLMGNGRHEIFPYRLNWKNRQRMGGFYSRNEFGAWDSAMRVHWDDALRPVGRRAAGLRLRHAAQRLDHAGRHRLDGRRRRAGRGRRPHQGLQHPRRPHPPDRPGRRRSTTRGEWPEVVAAPSSAPTSATRRPPRRRSASACPRGSAGLPDVPGAARRPRPARRACRARGGAVGGADPPAGQPVHRRRLAASPRATSRSTSSTRPPRRCSARSPARTASETPTPRSPRPGPPSTTGRGPRLPGRERAAPPPTASATCSPPASTPSPTSSSPRSGTTVAATRSHQVGLPIEHLEYWADAGGPARARAATPPRGHAAQRRRVVARQLGRAPRAGRRRRRHHRLQLPVPAQRHEGRARARRRQHRRAEAVAVHAATRRSCSPRPPPRPTCRRACSTSSPAAPTSARRSPPTPGSTWSASPAPTPSARRSWRRRRRR